MASGTFHRIPTQMPLQAVFMRGGAGPACMDDFVVDSWASDSVGSSLRAFPLLHNVVWHDPSQNKLSHSNGLKMYHAIRGHMEKSTP